MKVVLLILIVCSLYEFALAQGAITMATYRSKQQECIKEQKIPDAEAKHVINDRLVPLTSETFKCFHSCIYKKLGLIAKDKLNDAALLIFANMRFSKVPTETMVTKLKACNTKEPVDCKFLFKFDNCLAVSIAG
ncbi:hypothetical protein KR093_004545 [Drosophila rubida]|uniref:Uncharacterized protein n=1 Tax=Drosophila rubida TaxID=30044 RepID=A0AAD4PGV5_9MUSC|nr:hypothetical protein KR093_004545 [Drosophila rubida]